MGEDLKITLRMEGVSAEGGHVRLSDFIERLEALKASIDAIDRVVNNEQKSTLYYRVVSASHNSPLSIVIEPVKKTPKKQRDSESLLTQTHHKFFDELERLERGEMPSEDIGREELVSLQLLASKREGKFSKIEVFNSTRSFVIGKKLETSLNRLIELETVSYGTLEGTLEAVNIHGDKKNFWIFPYSGAVKVKCNLPKRLINKVKSGLGERVIVTGKKYYRINANFPHLIVASNIDTVPKFESEEHFLFVGGKIGDGSRDSLTIANETDDDW